MENALLQVSIPSHLHVITFPWVERNFPDLLIKFDFQKICFPESEKICRESIKVQKRLHLSGLRKSLSLLLTLLHTENSALSPLQTL